MMNAGFVAEIIRPVLIVQIHQMVRQFTIIVEKNVSQLTLQLTVLLIVILTALMTVLKIVREIGVVQ